MFGGNTVLGHVVNAYAFHLSFLRSAYLVAGIVVAGLAVSVGGLMSSLLDSCSLVLSDKLQMLRVEIVF